VSGTFKSFGDAPDGLKEEIKELCCGAEYPTKILSPLFGYFNESPKGKKILHQELVSNTPQLISMYLFSASKVPNPPREYSAFSLTFNFGDKYETY
jgi:hypothetical protein